MEKQISKNELDQYVKSYQESHPFPKRGPKTPEGIARAAQNLLKKKKVKYKTKNFPGITIKLTSILKDPHYNECQQNYFEKRHRSLLKEVPKKLHPQFEGILYFLVIQEIKLIEYFRILNTKNIKASEINRTMKLLDQSITNYNRLCCLMNQRKTVLNSEIFQELEALKLDHKKILKERNDFEYNLNKIKYL